MMAESGETEVPSGGSKLDELLIRWEELREQGQSIAVEDLCSDCPELAPELARRIGALRGMAPLLGESATLPESAPSGSGRQHRARGSASSRSEFLDLRFHAAG